MTSGEAAARTGEDSLERQLTNAIRVVPDFPHTGVRFQDLCPVFTRPDLVRRLGEAFTAAYDGLFDAVLAIEARGFILGTATSAAADRPLLLARKAGKLPGAVHRVTYDLEYGKAAVEVSRDAFSTGDRVLVVDDVLATGGTLAAAAELAGACGAMVTGHAVAVTIGVLNGTDRLAPMPVYSVLTV